MTASNFERTLLAVILAGCAVPQRQPDWAGVARETGRIVNR